MEESYRNGDQSVTILIPAYNPDEKLLQLLAELKSKFPRIVLVNDGSETGLDIFTQAASSVETILVHATNRGKGAALKTGLAYLGEGSDVVTVDADGQHTPTDIEKIAQALTTQRNGLVLGVRAFSGNVPLRSRFGNFWTRWVFFLMTGLMIRDTQTGLRGIPSALVSRLAAIPGERYEYEMAMLADAKNHDAKPVQIPIETIYINENQTSHFNPLKDTIRIYRSLLQFCLSSVLSFLLDNLIFALVLVVMTVREASTRDAILVSLIAARFVSANFNYFYNRLVVFKTHGRKRSFVQYWGLVLLIAAASYGLTHALSAAFGVSGLLITALKICAETFLFFTSYWIQKKFIFKEYTYHPHDRPIPAWRF